MNSKITRRGFLSAASIAAAPLIVPSTMFGQNAPSNRINIGCIGVRSMGHANINSFINFPDCRIAALCDVDSNVLSEREGQINDYYDNTDCKCFSDYREMLELEELDAVIIATPDHWHAPIAITAARKGLDIYGEKPVTHTHAEGKKLGEVALQEKIIWQTGSWQRSQHHWRRSVEIARNGLLGEIKFAEVGLPSGEPFPPKNDAFEIPENLNYDMWCGPSPVIEYHPQRTHYEWRWHYNFGAGQMLDWIGHHNDILHWMMELEHTSPIEVNMVDYRRPQDQSVWNAAWRYEYHCTYQNGFRSRITNSARQGVTLFGSEGWLHVNRGGLDASNPEWLKDDFDPGPVKAYKSENHSRNFLDCIKSREKTITPVEIAHRSATPGHLALISQEVGKPIKFDPETQEILDNEDATKLLKQQGDKMPWMPWRTDWCEDYLLEG